MMRLGLRRMSGRRLKRSQSAVQMFGRVLDGAGEFRRGSCHVPDRPFFLRDARDGIGWMDDVEECVRGVREAVTVVSGEVSAVIRIDRRVLRIRRSVGTGRTDIDARAAVEDADLQRKESQPSQDTHTPHAASTGGWGQGAGARCLVALPKAPSTMRVAMLRGGVGAWDGGLRVPVLE